ncbi:MAG: amidohydrolase family protein [Verrucomicrobiota bacterium]
MSEGAARLPEGNLAGSTLKFNDGLRLAAEVSGLELPELAAISSTHQARALGLDDRGEIRPGMLADLAITDQHFEVLSTVVGGELRWRA